MPESNTELARATLGQLKLVEILVVIAIVAVLIALLLPPVEWVSDGTRVLPVRVFVFDPQTGVLHFGAKIALSPEWECINRIKVRDRQAVSRVSDWKIRPPPIRQPDGTNRALPLSSLSSLSPRVGSIRRHGPFPLSAGFWFKLPVWPGHRHCGKHCGRGPRRPERRRISGSRWTLECA